MIPFAELPVLASLAPLAPPPEPVLRVEGPARPFPELLVGLETALAPATEVLQDAGDAAAAPEEQGQGGKDLPDPATPDTGSLPDQASIQVFVAQVAARLELPNPAPDVALQGETDVLADRPAPVIPERPRGVAVPGATAMPVEQAGLAPLAAVAVGKTTSRPTPDSPPAMPASDAAAVAVRPAETALPVSAPRDAMPASPAPATVAAAPVAAPGAQIEQLVEVLAQAREAGRGARGDLTLRHAEFGTVAIRLEQAEGETRATIAGRDPGIAPAVIAALAERAATGSFDLQPAPHQRSGENAFANGQGDPRQPDRRGTPERLPFANANPPPRDNDEPRNAEPRHGRFA